MTCKLKKFRYIPNVLTLIRILMIPLFLFFFYKGRFVYHLLALFTFVLASLTDLIDGSLARKYKWESSFGRFLDPLADKLLILTVFFSFALSHTGSIPLWPVIVILSRELIITFLRILAITKGNEVTTSFPGKLKTAMQMVTIITTLVLLNIKTLLLEQGIVKMPHHRFFWEAVLGRTGLILDYLPMGLVMIVMALTVYSGWLYILNNKRIIRS
ncbi:MAG: CDP-diacylglycerol--glycerol-3-phosphate 3-phosphatidyltransferase [Spirochaetes bacterium]|nr:CDP-diacylglycerol--glycerol-3-phosphate 3-phosphatidyltransferase [Spirochaetota bacterium]